MQTDIVIKGLIQNPSKSVGRFRLMSVDLRSFFFSVDGRVVHSGLNITWVRKSMLVCVQGLVALEMLVENVSVHTSLCITIWDHRCCYLMTWCILYGWYVGQHCRSWQLEFHMTC